MAAAVRAARCVPSHNSHGQSSLALARAMHCECITHQQSNLGCLRRRLMAVGVRDAPTDGMAGRGLTELQGVTIDFWGGPQLHLWPQAARPL